MFPEGMSANCNFYVCDESGEMKPVGTFSGIPEIKPTDENLIEELNSLKKWLNEPQTCIIKLPKITIIKLKQNCGVWIDYRKLLKRRRRRFNKGR